MLTWGSEQLLEMGLPFAILPSHPDARRYGFGANVRHILGRQGRRTSHCCGLTLTMFHTGEGKSVQARDTAAHLQSYHD